MAVGDGDGIDVQVFNIIVHRYPSPTFKLGVDSGIQEDAKTFHFNHPSAGSDAFGWIQIRNMHAGSLEIDSSNANAI
jgi:hypothetical protein